jgi:hypothetical protein
MLLIWIKGTSLKLEEGMIAKLESLISLFQGVMP